jgi:hypothetical protein
VLARAVAVTAVALTLCGHAAAHELPGGKARGYVATVARLEPNIVGVQARAVAGDQVLVSNLSRRPVVIFDPSGRPFLRIASGKSGAWHDPRVVEAGPPPSPPPGTAEDAPRFVKNWRIPGRAGGRPFAITGFLGWVPPEEGDEKGVPAVLLAGGALVLVALSAVAAYVLGRRRG